MKKYEIERERDREKERERDILLHMQKGLQENYDLVYHYTNVSNL